MSEVEIYRRALERIAKLNCRTCEQYVAKADAIAIDALVAGENVDDAGIENNVVASSLPRAA
jgi:hypothetical protein